MGNACHVQVYVTPRKRRVSRNETPKGDATVVGVSRLARGV